jgi:hypothetical protein
MLAASRASIAERVSLNGAGVVWPPSGVPAISLLWCPLFDPDWGDERNASPGASAPGHGLGAVALSSHLGSSASTLGVRAARSTRRETSRRLRMRHLVLRTIPSPERVRPCSRAIRARYSSRIGAANSTSKNVAFRKFLCETESDASAKAARESA